MTIFKHSYCEIIAALEEISAHASYEQDVRYRASGMNNAIQNFKLILCLVAVKSCLQCTKLLTLKLQSSSLDPGKAREKVSLLYLTLNDIHVSVNTTHTQLYEVAVKIASELNVTPTKPGIAARQVHRENIPAISPSEYFKRAVTIPFLDEIVNQVKSRFLEGNHDILDAMFVMLSSVVSNSIWKESFSRFLISMKMIFPIWIL